MSGELENGFGSGLRAQLQRKRGEPGDDASQAIELALAEPEQVPVVVQATVPELASLRAELEAALTRERELRDALQHQLEAYERGLAADTDLALRQAEVEQATSRVDTRNAELAERERALEEQEERLASERRELNFHRTNIVSEEARLAELGVHVDARAAELESNDHDHAHASAEIAKQLAAIAERERVFRGERTEAEARLSAREQAVVQQETKLQTREEAAGARERDLIAAEREAERVRSRLQERVQVIAGREDDVDGRLTARETTIAETESRLGDREAALSAWEERVRAQADRVERERAGHGRASQEAFTLMAELEQREETLKTQEEACRRREFELNQREAAATDAESSKTQAREQLLARGEAHLTTVRDQLAKREERVAATERTLSERVTEAATAEDELRHREAHLGAELELRAEKLDLLREELKERQRRLDEREHDLAAYVGELQREIA